MRIHYIWFLLNCERYHLVFETVLFLYPKLLLIIISDTQQCQFICDQLK